jgi:2-polyprenyl-3-methyl-5-hydroxy-6-metoxy-1,4-benzoquinol methylase
MTRACSAPVAGNVYNKYETRNPVSRKLMAGFTRSMFDLLSTVKNPAAILEVGCGEGFISRMLIERFPGARFLGTDLSAEVVETARRLNPGTDFEPCSIYELESLSRRFDLVVGSEVLEHLEEPRTALRSMSRVCRNRLFVSVPREPLWRVLNLARLKYFTALGNTPGHVQHWSTGEFLEFLRGEVVVEAHRTPLPWTQALCRPVS